MPQNTELYVAADAHVVLDFRGTKRIKSLKLGGGLVSGFIDATTHPLYFSGQGRLDVPPHETVIIMR